ncbi:hypothetical protein T09_11851 [Trichinella sp. T9]|nr:hypothetical protein T09_11851 [Trichinella sp. T9]
MTLLESAFCFSSLSRQQLASPSGGLLPRSSS